MMAVPNKFVRLKNASYKQYVVLMSHKFFISNQPACWVKIGLPFRRVPIPTLYVPVDCVYAF